MQSEGLTAPASWTPETNGGVLSDHSRKRLFSVEQAAIENIFGLMIDKLIRQLAREEFIGEQMHMLNQVDLASIKPSSMPSRSISELPSFQQTEQNTVANNNDCSFLKNAPERYESSFSKAAPSVANSRLNASTQH